MKLKYFIFIVFLCIGYSCDTQYFNTIPDARVYLTLHLDTDAYDMKLLSQNSCQIYDKSAKTIRVYTEVERTGYGGILVFHGQVNAVDTYFAYDLACPNEANPSVKVAVENTLFARCPKCKTKYEIWAGVGNPVEGPSKYPLKRYNGLSVNGSMVTIYN